MFKLVYGQPNKHLIFVETSYIELEDRGYGNLMNLKYNKPGGPQQKLVIHYSDFCQIDGVKIEFINDDVDPPE